MSENNDNGRHQVVNVKSIMAELISVPLKKPSEINIVKPLKTLIESTYSTADKPQDYTDPINELNKLRNNAIWRVFDKFESSLDMIYSYYDEIVALESKIPPNEVPIPFKWKDAFNRGTIFGGRQSLTISSLSYERVCVLFNIAALQSAVAASQSLDNDEGLKLAAKLFQQAAGIFNHLKNHVMAAVQQEPTPDLNPETLTALSSLMLAQAQEIFVTKAIHDNMKDAIIAKLCCQADDLYAEVLKLFQKESLKQLWEKEWIPQIAGKQCGFLALAEFYQSLVCKANKNIGEEIARLEHSSQLMKTAQSRSGKPNFLEEFAVKIQRNLTDAKKDNDFIYHERIPDIKKVDPIGKAMLAKALPVPERFGNHFKDLFRELVPVVVHQALATFDVRKSEIVNTEITKLRESTQTLNSVLASLNLPAAIEETKGDDLPQSLIDKAERIKKEGGAHELEKLLNNLPELLQRNTEILDETEKMLNEERDADESLRKKFGSKWSRVPSEKLTQVLRSNVADFRKIVQKAITADATVRQDFERHLPAIELLGKPTGEIKAAIPASNNSQVLDSSVVGTLRKLMEEVETIKAERDVIEHELKSTTIDMQAKFLHALNEDGAIHEAGISVETLGQLFGPLQKQVKESLAKQDNLIAEIQSAHSQMVRSSGGTAGRANPRDEKMKELAAAYDKYISIQETLKEGNKFYNDLTNLLLECQTTVSNFCFARKTEKEELMKDITHETSRQTADSIPTPPTYVTDGKSYDNAPYAGAPSTAPSVPATSSQLPYPANVQGMPVPYGATPATPYPTYTPAPMPSSYNPYGTIPYPYSAYNYPGFPQGPPNQGPYSGYQGQVPPNPGYPGGPIPGYPGAPPPPGQGYHGGPPGSGYPPYQQPPY